MAWRVPLSAQCVIGLFLAAGSLAMPESPRWLLDTDRDEEGMRVIVDLHGGDPEDVIAKAEFAEIKERVMIEVCRCKSGPREIVLTSCCSEKAERPVHTLPCGSVTNDAFCLQCRLKHSHNW